jgi:hypothetical protein
VSETSVIDLVKQGLRAGGFDGLLSDDGECGCEVDDLAPCTEILGSCVAGWRVAGCDPGCGQGCDFHMTAVKPAVLDLDGGHAGGEEAQHRRAKAVARAAADAAVKGMTEGPCSVCVFWRAADTPAEGWCLALRRHFDARHTCELWVGCLR